MMTYKELTDYIYRLISSQARRMSDEVDTEVADMIRGAPEHIDVAEYWAKKYGIKERW